MRVFSEEKLGILREYIIGSAPEVGYKDGKIVRLNALHRNLALGPGKPEHIFARSGRINQLYAYYNQDIWQNKLIKCKPGILFYGDVLSLISCRGFVRLSFANSSCPNLINTLFKSSFGKRYHESLFRISL